MKKPGASLRRAFVVDEPGGSVVVERLARLVLEPADGVLNLAGALLRRAFGVGLGVARHLAGDFLHLAFGLLDRTFDAILVHRSCPLMLSWESQGQRTGSRPGSALQHVVNRKAACQTTHAKETRPAPVWHGARLSGEPVTSGRSCSRRCSCSRRRCPSCPWPWFCFFCVLCWCCFLGCFLWFCCFGWC